MSHRKYRIKWRAEGKCINCGMERPSSDWNFVYCPRCRDATLRSKAKGRAKAKSHGKCISCRTQNPDGWPYSKCEKCRDRQRRQNDLLREERFSKKQCTVCGANTEPRRKMCRTCLDKAKDKQQKRATKFKLTGLCRDCGKCAPRPMKLSCQECHVDNRYGAIVRRQKFSIAGMCILCGQNQPVEKCKWCGPCRLKKKEAYCSLRLRVMNQYGGPKCRCCQESHIEFLEIDHVNGDGASHRKRTPGARSIYTWLRHMKYPPGFQVLCGNCNAAKYRFGECPHERERRNGSAPDPQGDS